LTTANIERALNCALKDGLNCLVDTNPGLAFSLWYSLFRDSASDGAPRPPEPLDIACGGQCDGKIANTFSWQCPFGPGCALFQNSTTNINAAEFNALDSSGQCNSMLHELLHWAGNPGVAGHDLSANDEIYSCGRYCGKCSHALRGTPNNSSVDCARCADSPTRKAVCGAAFEFPTVACTLPAYAYGCTDGIGGTLSCQKCTEVDFCYCDETPWPGSTGVANAIPCCQSCVAGSEFANTCTDDGTHCQGGGPGCPTPPFNNCLDNTPKHCR
jgi:hypothetical protein